MEIYFYITIFIILGVAFFSKFRTGNIEEVVEDTDWPTRTGFYWIHYSPIGSGFLLSFKNAVPTTPEAFDIGGI